MHAKRQARLGWSFLAALLLFLAALWIGPAMASPVEDSPTPTPTPLPTPDLDVGLDQVANLWLIVIAGGVLLALLALSTHLMYDQLTAQPEDKNEKDRLLPRD